MPWASRQPSPEAQAVINDFNTFRGGYLNSFAQIEFTVGRLLSRFNVTPPFEGSQDDVKFRFESRLKAFEEFLRSRSELSDFSSQGLKLCEKFRAMEDRRNFFAHGIVRYDVDTHIFTVRRILPSREDPWQEVSIEIHATEIYPQVSRMSLLAQEFMHFARDLSDTFRLQF